MPDKSEEEPEDEDSSEYEVLVTRRTCVEEKELMLPTSTESRAAATDAEARKEDALKAVEFADATDFASMRKGSVNVVSTSTESRERDSENKVIKHNGAAEGCQICLYVPRRSN
eukprot:7869560-Karenia_brevis.AAC.1